MTTTAPARSLASSGAAFLGLSVLPFVMNTFPTTFARAFSEHADTWTVTSLLIMTLVIAAWALSLFRLGIAWRTWRSAPEPGPWARWFAARPRPAWRPVTWRGQRVLNLALVLHGPILFVLFYVMFSAGRLANGRWPILGSVNDPKQLAGTQIVYWLICAWFWLFPLALARPVFSAALGATPRTHAVRIFGLTFALQAAFFLMIVADPHGLYRWFRD